MILQLGANGRDEAIKWKTKKASEITEAKFFKVEGDIATDIGPQACEQLCSASSGLSGCVCSAGGWAGEMRSEKRDKVATQICNNQVKLIEQAEDWDSEKRISKIVDLPAL